MRVEIRRVNGATWVRLDKGLAVVPIALIDELREHWTAKVADAVMKEEAVVNLLDGDGGKR